MHDGRVYRKLDSLRGHHPKEMPQGNASVPDLLDLEIFGRFFAAVRNEFEVELLALIQSTEARTFHCRDVNEYVFAATA